MRALPSWITRKRIHPASSPTDGPKIFPRGACVRCRHPPPGGLELKIALARHAVHGLGASEDGECYGTRIPTGSPSDPAACEIGGPDPGKTILGGGSSMFGEG